MEFGDLLPQFEFPWNIQVASDNPSSLADAWTNWLVLGTIAFAIVWIVAWAIPLVSYFRYRSVLKGCNARTFESKRQSFASEQFPLNQEFERSMVATEKGLMRTESGASLYSLRRFAPLFWSMQPLFRALPGLLIAGGILGTFVGLTLGIGSVFNELDSTVGSESTDTTEVGTQLEQNIEGLLGGASTAFRTSVAGVALSILATLGYRFSSFLLVDLPMSSLHRQIDRLAPAYTPERALLELSRSSASAEGEMKTLAQKIGAQMQTSIQELGKELGKAVTGQSGEHAIEAGRQLREGLEDELGKISGTVDGLSESVTSVTESIRGQADILKALEATTQKLKEGEEHLNSFGEKVKAGAERNYEAATAQERASTKNEEVAKKFEVISDGLPGINEAIMATQGSFADLGPALTSLASNLGGGSEMSPGVLTAISGLANELENLKDVTPGIKAAASELSNATSELKEYAGKIGSASDAQLKAAEAGREAANASVSAANALKPVPTELQGVSVQLANAGNAVGAGAESATAALSRVLEVQEQWNGGVEIGLGAMRDHLENIMTRYGESIDQQTRGLLDQWSEQVGETLEQFNAVRAGLDDNIGDLEDQIDQLKRRS